MELGQFHGKKQYPIHRDPPKFENLSTRKEVLYTGIKVIDLIDLIQKEVKLVCLVVPVLAKRLSSWN